MTWNSNAGRPLDTSLAAFWPPKNVAEGSGVAGEVVEFGSYKVKDETVPSVTLANAVTRELAEGGRWRMINAGDVTVSLNRLLRTALRADKTPVGTCVQIEFAGKDENMNGMHIFRVSIVPADYCVSLLRDAIKVG